MGILFSEWCISVSLNYHFLKYFFSQLKNSHQPLKKYDGIEETLIV